MTSPDLSLWTVESDDNDLYLLRGREAAEQMSIRLIQTPAVTSVSCSPLEPGSRAEAEALAYGGFGLEPMLSDLVGLAVERGFDVEIERCDPYALLLALREWEALGGLSDEQVWQIAERAFDAAALVVIDSLRALGFGPGTPLSDEARRVAECTVYAAIRDRIQP